MKIYIVPPFDLVNLSEKSKQLLDQAKSTLKQRFKDDYIQFFDYSDLTSPSSSNFTIMRSILSAVNKFDPDYFVFLHGWQDCPRAEFEYYIYAEMYPGRTITSETMDCWMKEFGNIAITTVGDLIKVLEKYPSDSEIYVDRNINTYYVIRTIECIPNKTEDAKVAIKLGGEVIV